MLENVLLIVNPVAGRGEAKKYSLKLAELLTATYNAKTNIKYTVKEGDAVEWARTASAEGYDTVICLGGDGTVSETVTGLIEADQQPLFGFIPLGTVNDLGRALGYSMQPDEAIERFKRVTIDKLDIGKVNDQIFINVLALGPIAEEVMKTKATDKNKFGVFAYIRDGLKAFFNDKGYKVTVTRSDGSQRELTTNLLFIALTNSVGGVEFMFRDATYKDGLLHLAAIKGHTPLDMIKAGIDAGFANLDANNFYRISDTSFTIETSQIETVETNLDGDKGPNLPLKVEVLNHALDVIIPK